jgi:hypothetical protein
MKSMGYGRWGWRARSILIHAGEFACGGVGLPDSCSLIGTWDYLATLPLTLL